MDHIIRLYIGPYLLHIGSNFETTLDAYDGKFWMAWPDFLAEFESLSICMIPNAESSNYHRVIGDVHGGVNAPSDLAEVEAGKSDVFLAPNKTHQIKLKVNSKKQSVVMQTLFHMPGKLKIYNF